jgi:4-hydroxy-tetrahydrodipicolinate synthase
MSLRQKLCGTGVAIVTPFKKNLAVDIEAYKKLVDFVINNKADYIVVLGTTGETPVLTKDEKKLLVATTFEVVNNRVPVVVGVSGNNTAEVIKELGEYSLDKATAVLSASPYYNKPSQEGIFQHYKAIAEVSPKPIILYNVPGRTGKNIEASTILRLAHEVRNIAGIKEASGDMIQCMEILLDKPDDFLVLSGEDALALPQLACGMDGVISVAANSFPADFSEMVRCCMRQDFAKARILNDKLIPAYQLLFVENNPAGVKAFLHEMGMIENELRLPLVPLSKKYYQQVQAYLETHSVGSL